MMLVVMAILTLDAFDGFGILVFGICLKMDGVCSMCHRFDLFRARFCANLFLEVVNGIAEPGST